MPPTVTMIDWGTVGRIDRPVSTSVLLLLDLATDDGAGTARARIARGSAPPWAETAASGW